MDNILQTIFTGSFTLNQFLIALGFSIVLGLFAAFVFMYKNTYSKSIVLALTLIPAIETIVIMIVNDNLGLGLSVAGSFALIRFRSIKGNARELTSVFLAMTIGIICGTGYVVLAALYTAIICLVMFLIVTFNIGKPSENKRYLKITIPESLNYDEVFDGVLKKYTKSYVLESVKTLTLGSLFRVEYTVIMNNSKQIKEMIDELRVLNGNLEIFCGREFTNREEL